ncbi:tubulin glycylase 3A-like isoform X2 [Athalia rosae]|uniref:tubulin glycylase 3A-like isoform X2 n=1 Tax=Athalia rosae TaxID=37344 RepID=UPI002034544C|nr:tubulin glycylase 3A-like isoform X2 [Athalia rosae]
MIANNEQSAKIDPHDNAGRAEKTNEDCKEKEKDENSNNHGDIEVAVSNDENSTDKSISENVTSGDSQLTSTLPPTLQERFLRIKQMVKDAIAAHHTFMIYGRSRVVRECMLRRGWCEKYYRKSVNGIGDLKDQQSERLLISKMLGSHVVDFLWNTGSEWPGWPAQDNKTTVFNRFCRAGFTSKIGLCSNVRQMHWYYEAGVANTLFPRCYNICQGDQMHAFVEDFRFTACLGLLKWLVDKMSTEGENATRSSSGTIPLKALDFAIRRCSDYIGAQSHDDIDQEVERVWSHQWDQFICWYYKIILGQALFVLNNVPFHKYFLAAKHILKRIRKYWPQLDMDGIMNVWILKPGNKSRGRGITLMNKLEDVVAKINPANKSDTRYVVQKYIERPLLVYSTKFDIRQWFIVTCAQPLTLWMYRESYLRFCSQTFRLTDFHESIHLCNHAIQCKYKNSDDRDPALPADNMWDATTFKQFLKAQGHNDVWDELIYPGMKQSLVGSLLASQEAMDRRKNSFELYGADFMVMEDFSVWLIEINSHPDMSYTTSVTSRLCRQVMEDTIKVVVDSREDKNADTGKFELAYRQRMPSCQPYLGAALSLQGTRIVTTEKKPNTTGHDSKLSLVSKSPATCLNHSKSAVHTYIGPVIVDLIEELEIQLDQEFYAYYKLDSPRLRHALTAPEFSMSSKTSIGSSQKIELGTTTSTETPPSSNKIKSPNQNKAESAVKSIAQKPATGKQRMTQPLPKVEVTARQTLISKTMEVKQPQTAPVTAIAPRMEKLPLKKHNEEKVISAAMQNAINKYKRKGVIPPEASSLSTLVGPNQPGKLSQAPSARNRHKSSQRKQGHSKKTKVLSDITDMYAVGLGLTK